jgi:3-oxoacyl-[acyl-carrier protein] reductase
MQELIVVTGGSSGIGRACVRQALDRGRYVVNLDIKAPAAATSGPEETFIETDLRRPEAIEVAFNRIAALGLVVGLVNNAGLSLAKPLMDTSVDDFDRLAPLNLVAPMLCAKRAIESMREAGWGRIVNVSSRVVLGKEQRTVYAATKGGITAMTRVWALELAALGITVNTVGPGPIATELFEAVNPPGDPTTERIIAAIPVRRLGTPDDVASAVMFFLSQEAGFVTGQTLYVCGGMSIGAYPA